jgi:hypothetical protein
MDARVTTLTVKGLDCFNADWARTVSTLKGNHEAVVFMSYRQDDIVLSEFASYLVPDTFRTFNVYRLTRSARPLNGAYQSLKVSACLCHLGPFEPIVSKLLV